MAVRSNYYTRDKISISPGSHGSHGHPQKLDFLEDFDYDDYRHQTGQPKWRILETTDQEKLLDENISEAGEDDHIGEYRSRSSADFWIATWLIMSFVTGAPLFIAILISIGAAFAVDVPLQEAAQEYFGSFTNTASLARRQSQAHPRTPTTLPFLHRRLRSIVDPASSMTSTTQSTRRHNPYQGQHPDWQPRRLWSEALRTSYPHFLALAAHVLHVAIQFIYFQLLLQLLVTTAQTLGSQFYAGTDTLGLFPRYWANLTSVENLFGIAGKQALNQHVKFVAGWWWDWIFGLTTFFLWHLPRFLWQCVFDVMMRAVTTPGERIAGSAWDLHVGREFDHTAPAAEEAAA